MTGDRRTSAKKIAEFLAGSDASLTALGIGLRLILILLWHGFLISIWNVASWDIRAGMGPQVINYGYYAALWALQSKPTNLDYYDWISSMLSVPALVFVEGLLAFGVFALVVGKRKQSGWSFFTYWWRSCLWGTVVVLLVWRLGKNLYPLTGHLDWELLLLAYALTMPGVLVWADLRPKWRMPKWRPACPECGHNVRRTVEPRCAECGVPYPTDQPTYRRWAVKRLPWDRMGRPRFAPWAYCVSFFQILCCPCRAVRGTSIPDRMERAWRWAIAHVIVGAIVGVLAGSGGSHYYDLRTAILNFVDPLNDPLTGISTTEFGDPTMARKLLWGAQSWTAWFIVLATPVALTYMIPSLVFGWSGIARAGMRKWSLYISSVLPAILFAALVITRLNRGFTNYHWYVVSCGPELTNIAVGLLWSIGAMSNPLLPRRTFGMGAQLFVVYASIWYFLVFVCFPPQSLRELL